MFENERKGEDEKNNSCLLGQKLENRKWGVGKESIEFRIIRSIHGCHKYHFIHFLSHCIDVSIFRYLIVFCHKKLRL